ncbi:hypothetical protein AgCh_038748 [Apium graveolens]
MDEVVVDEPLPSRGSNTDLREHHTVIYQRFQAERDERIRWQNQCREILGLFETQEDGPVRALRPNYILRERLRQIHRVSSQQLTDLRQQDISAEVAYRRISQGDETYRGSVRGFAGGAEPCATRILILADGGVLYLAFVGVEKDLNAIVIAFRGTQEHRTGLQTFTGSILIVTVLASLMQCIEVAAVVADLSPLLACSILLNSIQPVLSGVALGAGWQSSVAYVNIACYYLTGILVRVVLGYYLDVYNSLMELIHNPKKYGT